MAKVISYLEVASDMSVVQDRSSSIEHYLKS